MPCKCHESSTGENQLPTPLNASELALFQALNAAILEDLEQKP